MPRQCEVAQGKETSQAPSLVALLQVPLAQLSSATVQRHGVVHHWHEAAAVQQWAPLQAAVLATSSALALARGIALALAR